MFSMISGFILSAILSKNPSCFGIFHLNHTKLFVNKVEGSRAYFAKESIEAKHNSSLRG